MGFLPSSWTVPLFRLNAAQDAGDQLPFDDVWKAAEDGELVEFLHRHLPRGLGLVQDEDKAVMNEFFQRQVGLGRAKLRKAYGVQHNGLPLAIALFLEGIQEYQQD